ncbi:MAG TPA: hypothetical protein HPP83_05620 [Candidatus Hydrogenedentes bacterium]|nr:hypothetical protein [Candidatus Hydrogenedentota bacterium]
MRTITSTQRAQIRALLMAAAAFCACSAFVYCPAYSELTPADQLEMEMTLTTPRCRIQAFEPLVLDINIRNVSDAEARLRGPVCTWGPHFRVHISPAEGEAYKYEFPRFGQLCGPPSPPVPLGPQSVFAYRQILLRCADGPETYAFALPGEYKVGVRYEPRTGAVFEAAPLVVTVVEPEGREAEALELWKQGKFWFLGVTRPRPERERLRTEYGDTVYGQYARFLLAHHQAIRRPESKPEGWTESEYLRYPFAESARRLLALLQDAPDFPLADQCMLDLASAYRYSHRRQEAVAVLGELLQDFPTSPTIPEAQALLDQLESAE